MFDSEAVRAEGFRKQAFEDELTGFDNRKAFDVRFGELLESKESSSAGMVVLLEVDGLKAYNTGSSYRQGNQLLAALAEAGKTVLGARGTILGRLGGAGFGFVMADMGVDEGRVLCDQLHRAAVEVVDRLDPAGAVSFSQGAVYFRGGDQRGQIMGKADLSVEAARQAGRNQRHILPLASSEQDALGSLGWRDLLRSALSQGRWRLLGQPVVSFATGKTIQSEVMVRLTDLEGKLVPAGTFIPMALRHKMMPDVDTAVVTLVIRRLNAYTPTPTPTQSAPRMAVNISMQSLQSPAFFGWLGRELQGVGARAQGLAFELSRFGAAQDIELARRFAALVRKHGAQFGIDRFGLDPNSLQTLRQLPPDYVKLDSALVKEASDNEATKELVNAIVNLARSLEVAVIARGVENDDQAEALKLTHDAGQGYFFGAPAELDT